MVLMQSDSAARTILVRGIPLQLWNGLRLAAEDRGVSQTDIIKDALWDWLAARRYVIPPSVTRVDWVEAAAPDQGANTDTEQERGG